MQQRCPLCQNHCSVKALSCNKGRRHFNEEIKEISPLLKELLEKEASAFETTDDTKKDKQP